MSERELRAVITAQDKNAATTFRAVASGADRMGTAVSAAGAKGAKGLADQGKSASDLNTRMAALGAASATAAAVLAGWSRSSEDAAAIQRQLEASIAATGDSYSTYADRIAEAGARAVQLGQDDEAASQAISALTQVTGSANVALDQMGLVMDLAAAKHMSLESAAELVGKVLGGNVAILNRSGFAIDENATATEALATVQRAVAGQAEASATTYARLREEFSNVTDAIGGTVGGLAPLLSMLPGVSVGFTAVGSAVGALAPGLTKASAGSAALNLALGPLGIVAGAAAAGVAIYELVKRFDDANLSAKEAEGQVKSFDEVLAGIGKQGGGNLDLIGPYRQVLVDLAVTTQNATDQLAFAWADAATAQSAYQEAVSNGKDAETQQTLLAQADAAQKYAESLEGLKLNEEQLSNVAADFVDIFTDMNPLNADLVIAKMAELRQQLYSGILTSDQYVDAVDELNASSDSYGLTIDEIVKGERARTDAMNGTTDALHAAALMTGYLDNAEARRAQHDYEGDDAKVKAFQEYTTNLHNAALMVGYLNGQEARSVQHDYEDDAAKVDAYNQSLEDQKVAAIATKFATDGNTMSLGALFKTSTEGAPGIIQDSKDQAAATKAATDAMVGYATALAGTISLATKLRPLDINVKGGDKVTGTADDAMRAGAALDSVLGVFNQIDAMGKGHQQAGSIAENLIGKPGELGEIDKLLNDGRISLTRYNDTVAAGNNIMGRSAEIEADLNVIRTKQLPLLDQADERYAGLIDDISHMSSEQATATLGFMDANESMKAQNALALAAAAANTEVGSTARQAAQASIEGAIAADPYLKEMLKSIGLITEDKEGNITINFDNADSLNKSTDALTASINALIVALGGIPPNTEADIKLLGADVAQDGLDNIINKLALLDGMTANAVANITIQTTGSAPAGFGLGLQAGGRLGGVFNFANGGVVQLAEAGPEMLSFANGGLAMAMNPGFYAVPNQTLVHTAPATKAKLAGMGGGGFTFNNYGAIHGMSGIDEVVSSFERSLRAHLTGLGVL